jgi:hypothetical protein
VNACPVPGRRRRADRKRGGAVTWFAARSATTSLRRPRASWPVARPSARSRLGCLHDADRERLPWRPERRVVSGCDPITPAHRCHAGGRRLAVQTASMPQPSASTAVGPAAPRGVRAGAFGQRPGQPVVVPDARATTVEQRSSPRPAWRHSGIEDAIEAMVSVGLTVEPSPRSLQARPRVAPAGRLPGRRARARPRQSFGERHPRRARNTAERPQPNDQVKVRPWPGPARPSDDIRVSTARFLSGRIRGARRPRR